MLHKWMTTKCPLCLGAMELVAQLGERQLRLDLQLKRRGLNVEADALTNGDFSLFCPELRVPAEQVWDKLICLPSLVSAASACQAALAEARLTAASRQGVRPRARRVRLRAREPW